RLAGGGGFPGDELSRGSSEGAGKGGELFCWAQNNPPPTTKTIAVMPLIR
ncbi:2554_t:CDS:1, partial [Ambispora leptoticha]